MESPEEVGTPEERGLVVGTAVSAVKGTVKTPVEGVVCVPDHGIAGDAHAGPGPRQVSILALESIRRMEERFGETLGIGRFGENVVVSGCDLASVALGDRLGFGDSVVLEVTAIGKECHFGCEIRRRTGDCIMPREGVFARVVAGGPIRPGMAVGIRRPKGGDR